MAGILLCGPPFPMDLGPHRVHDPGVDPEDDFFGAVEELSRARDGEILVPLCEEFVLPCGLLNRSDGLTRELARRAVDRKAQKALLGPLTPPWLLVETDGSWGALCVKARASTLSRNVMTTSGYPERLAMFGPREARESLVVEKYVPGPSYEVCGVVGRNPARPLRVWPAVREIWDRPAGRIVEYRRVQDPSTQKRLRKLAEDAVFAVGLRMCGFSVETKGTAHNERVLEVHARLGEEPDRPEYYRQWADDEDPYRVMADILSAEADKR